MPVYINGFSVESPQPPKDQPRKDLSVYVDDIAIETQARVGLLDVSSGLIKSVFFGVAVGLAGCLRGLQCERSAAGVGSATSSAVVTGILLIILADALFAVVFNVLGI